MRKLLISLSTTLLLVSLISVPYLMKGTSKKVVRPVMVVVNTPDSSAAIVTAVSEAGVLYDSLQLSHKGLSKEALIYALKGFNALQKKGLLLRSNIISICDFSQSSKNKRLYIIDVNSMKLLFNTYVAHGKNSGQEYANSFSNKPESLKSSLGFYITRNTYTGCHGLSLKIQGLEKGFNDMADARNIVVHGSQYVGPDFIRYNHFSGRSFGCPALPAEQTPFVINTIKEGTCLFIYHPSPEYLTKSKLINS